MAREVVMSSSVRRFALMVHVTCSVGWIGAVMAYLCLGLAASRNETPAVVRAAWTGMGIVGLHLLVPLAIGTWATGLVVSLGTRWGLFRHYWVLVSFVLTTLATAALVVHVSRVRSIADAVQAAPPSRLDRYGGDLAHGFVALAFLLALQALNVYKPWGTTRIGWQRAHRERLARVARRRPGRNARGSRDMEGQRTSARPRGERRERAVPGHEAEDVGTVVTPAKES